MKYFVSGIHTDAGKSYCTGWFARRLMDEGKKVLTQKFIQTGNNDMSEDIEVHRRIMGTGYFPEDLDHTTAPLIFTHPCSPQLAARLDHRDIDLNVIDRSSETLEGKCDVLLIEGAGGLMVPITDDYFTIDYVADRHLPLIMVVNGSLGSINHAILSFEAIERRKIEMPYVLYNTHFDYDPLISEDTYNFISRYLAKHFPGCRMLNVPSIK
ncbi:MAG: dethiobiotin synthase [Bacteroidales bacterium]|nr:dethiobiotin synthase [Bacteroidales bacterium]